MNYKQEILNLIELNYKRYNNIHEFTGNYYGRFFGIDLKVLDTHLFEIIIQFRGWYKDYDCKNQIIINTQDLEFIDKTDTLIYKKLDYIINSLFVSLIQKHKFRLDAYENYDGKAYDKRFKKDAE